MEKSCSDRPDQEALSSNKRFLSQYYKVGARDMAQWIRLLAVQTYEPEFNLLVHTSNARHGHEAKPSTPVLWLGRGQRQEDH